MLPFFFLLSGFFLICLLLLLWGRFYEPYAYQLQQREADLDLGLLQPLKILHLSDTHFLKRNKQLDAFFKKIYETKYDLIFVTGDIIDEGKVGIPICEYYLSGLNTKYGIFAVLGNHDYANYGFNELIVHSFKREKVPKVSNDILLLKDSLWSIGIHLLRNETIPLHIEDKVIYLHGLDDPVTKHDQPEKIRANISMESSNFLLVHSVDGLARLNEPNVALAFSGHSHGGQIRIPKYGALFTHTKLGRKYASGLLTYGKTLCSVSRGVGTSRFLPIRLFCRPEAIELSVS